METKYWVLSKMVMEEFNLNQLLEKNISKKPNGSGLIFLITTNEYDAMYPQKECKLSVKLWVITEL